MLYSSQEWKILKAHWRQQGSLQGQKVQKRGGSLPVVRALRLAGSTEHPNPVSQPVSIFRVRASLAWAIGSSRGGDPKGKAYTMGVLALVYLTFQKAW